MRKKAYVGALRPNDDYLALITLRHADEVLSARDLPAPHARGLTSKELKMADQLVGALEGEFDPEEFRDEYRDRVLDFIAAKAKGKKIKLPTPREWVGPGKTLFTVIPVPATASASPRETASCAVLVIP